MVVDRIERHDIVNAVLLGIVLLLAGFGIITAARSLVATVDSGFVESAKPTEPDTPASPTAAADGEGDEPTADDDEGNPLARPPGEVSVRVGNGANKRPGVAGAGSAALQAAGYQTLPPKNAATIDNSVVYYAEGYGADADKVAQLLGIDAVYVETMPIDPGIEIEGANIIVILGVNADF